MRNSSLRKTAFKLNDAVSFELADTPEARWKAFALRHQVYCVDHDFLVGQNGVKHDEFNDRPLHVVARCRRTGEAVGTMRILLQNTPPARTLCSFTRERLGGITTTQKAVARAGWKPAVCRCPC